MILRAAPTVFQVPTAPPPVYKYIHGWINKNTLVINFSKKSCERHFLTNLLIIKANFKKK
jgi:hypothetical protein